MFSAITNKNDLLHRRAKVREKGEALIEAAKKANRDLSASEQTSFDDLMGELKGINTQLDEHAKGAHGGGNFESVFPMANSVPAHFGGMPGSGHSLRAALANATEEQREEIHEIGQRRHADGERTTRVDAAALPENFRAR